jgi:hypothetical protein
METTRLIIALIPIGVIMYFVEKYDAVDKNAQEIFMVLLQIATGIVYYFMLTSSFRRVSEKR